MQIDIKGKINEKKLAYSNTLLPLFEAIVNSIQAIEENKVKGLIQIDISRLNQTQLQLDKSLLPDIIDFQIKDNGIGFNTENYESFNYAHSTYKFSKGGKGIGRFSWLRAFKRAEIHSQFKEDGKWYERNFVFEPTKKGIEKHELHEIPQGETFSVVRLVGLKEDYRKWCNNNPEDIAFKIIEHCFVYFLKQDCPTIVINDERTQLVVNDLFAIFTKNQVKPQNLKIRNNEFKLNFVKLYGNRMDNKIHYCANTREVINDKISIDIPELDNFLYDSEGNQFSIAVYVEGNYLNENTNDERTSIAFAKGEIQYPDQTTQEELRKAITDKLQDEFSDQIDELSKQRVSKVREFVGNHPRYRQLLKYRANEIRKIPSTLTDEKMEIELFKIQQGLDLEVKQEASVVLKFIDGEDDKIEFMEKHKELYNKIIEVGNSKLSEYVIHRKLVLDLFEKLLRLKSTEKAVHNLIFPLQTISDEIGFEDHNLWMIDERLSYHKYLASDKRFSQVAKIDVKSNERPDLIVFNKPFAFASDNKPYESIVLIEFKRPMRDDYDDDENPIQQINRYARKIIAGEAKDKFEREFDLRKNTPIYAYVICDLTKKLKAYAEESGYKLLPDGAGYFAFNDNYNMYIEILSFDKILSDSKERNRVLFDKLNLS